MTRPLIHAHIMRRSKPIPSRSSDNKRILMFFSSVDEVLGQELYSWSSELLLTEQDEMRMYWRLRQPGGPGKITLKQAEQWLQDDRPT